MKQIITLGAGCFWGTQAYFDLIPGVIKTTVGYANGQEKNVTYQQVCTGKTAFIEVCQIEYDPEIINLKKLLEKYWTIIDPTIVDRQSNDYGHQYQSAILYNLNDEKNILPIILASKNVIQKNYKQSIMTLIAPLTNYVLAEKYHQKYLDKNPNGYCHITLPKK